MAIEYPDIISEYLVATERYESDGVQIVPYLEPAEVAINGHTTLALLLQNAVDVPVELTFRLEMPQTGRLRGVPMLAVGEPELRAKLESAQVGTLFVPLQATSRAKEGQHEIRIHVSVVTEERGNRVRPAETAGRFRSKLIDDVVGLELARVLGVPFRAKFTRKISLPITIRGQVEAEDKAPDLATSFESLWKLEDIELQVKALQEVGHRRAIIVENLQMEPLYVALFVEGQKRFADAGLPLRVGEAIALGKILTYTTRYFLASGDLQDGLLVPIWELASYYDLPTTDPLWVLRNVGFQHLLRLSVALSFGLIGQALGRQPWAVEERRAVTSLVAHTVEGTESLPPEFLYIPLLMAATYISHQIPLDGEDVGHSLRLLQKAKAAHADVFADPDLAEANQLFDRLMRAALQ